jgi:predicted RNA-binding protein with TRAM domain
MEIPDQLHCLFSATVEKRDESYLVEVPKQEGQLGNIQQGETYRVALLPAPSDHESERGKKEPQREGEPQAESEPSKPPVEAGERRSVEIENLGDQGDGITRVERGFVVIVPDTERGERVTVEITDVLDNVAFAEVVERLSYYD